MAEYWLDYSGGTLSARTIKSTPVGPAGEVATGVIRYVTAPGMMNPPGKLPKHTTKAEYQDHASNGLEVRLCYQGDTKDADSGYAGGQTNAQRALAGALYLGYPGRIYFTNDRTTLPDPALWRAYLDGAASVLGADRVGAYGFRNAQDAAIGHATGFWQSGRRSELAPHANFWQDNNTQVTVGGITCDRNLIIRRDTAVALTTDEIAAVANKIFWGTEFDINGALHRNFAAYLKDSINNLNAQVVQANTAIAGLSAAVARLSTDPNITVEELTTIVNTAIAQHVQITGTVQIGPAPTS